MRTGPDFDETHTLKDGTVVHLRHIRPDDGVELRRAFQRLSPTSRFRRFFGSITELDDATVHYLTHVDGVDHVAIVARHGLARPQGRRRDRRCAVHPPCRPSTMSPRRRSSWWTTIRGTGIGTLLAMALGDAARERGITRFRAEVLTSNDPARQLLEDVHAQVIRQDDQSFVFDIPIPNGESGPSTRLAMVRRLLREAARQVAGFVRSLHV